MEPVDNNPASPIQSSVSEAPVQVPPLPNQPTTPKRKLPFIIPLVIILFLLAVSSVAGYVIYKNTTKPDTALSTTPALEQTTPTSTPTPDPTANWKTYRGDGFEFKYPQDGFVKELNGSFSALIAEDPPICLHMRGLVVDVDVNNLKDWIVKNSIMDHPDGTTRSEIKGAVSDYSEGELLGYWYEGGTETTSKNVFLINDDTVIKITLVAPGAGESYKSCPNNELLLSTFKFTD